MTRAVMVELWAPSARFPRQIGQVCAEGPTFGRLVEVGVRHGLALAAE